MKRVDPAFLANAKAHMLRYLRCCKARRSTSERMVDACKRVGIVPADDRNFGGAVQALRRAGLILPLDNCKRTKGHGTNGGTVYEAARVRK